MQTINRPNAVGYFLSTPNKFGIENGDTEYRKIRINDYCTSNNIALVDLYIDGIETQFQPIFQRTQGKKILQDFENGFANHFVSVDLSQCFIDIDDAKKQINKLHKLGVSFHFIDIGVNTTLPGGDSFIAVINNIAEIKNGFQVEKPTKIKKKKRWNHVPYGYIRDEQGELLKDKKEQKAIRLMRKMREGNASYADIAHELELHGYKPKHAQKWSGAAVWKILGRYKIKT